jgi:hypothetical protein
MAPNTCAVAHKLIRLVHQAVRVLGPSQGRIVEQSMLIDLRVKRLVEDLDGLGR